MFLVRTAVTMLGTASARDALVRLEAMERAGHEPTVTRFNGRPLNASDLERWIGPRPARGSTPAGGSPRCRGGVRRG